MARWFESLRQGEHVFIAIGIDNEGDTAMKVSSGVGGRIWDVELDLAERMEFVWAAKREGWPLKLEWEWL